MGARLKSADQALRYVTDLMAKNYEAVGFLPAPRIEQYARAGQLWLQQENDEPCGYLIFGRGWPTLRVYQTCIQVDARNLDHATALVGRLIQTAEREGYEAISLHCADDLEANAFWAAMGFQFGGTRDNGNRRGRLHNKWVYWLSAPLQPNLFCNLGER